MALVRLDALSCSSVKKTRYGCLLPSCCFNSRAWCYSLPGEHAAERAFERGQIRPSIHSGAGLALQFPSGTYGSTVACVLTGRAAIPDANGRCAETEELRARPAGVGLHARFERVDRGARAHVCGPPGRGVFAAGEVRVAKEGRRKEAAKTPFEQRMSFRVLPTVAASICLCAKRINDCVELQVVIDIVEIWYP